MKIAIVVQGRFHAFDLARALIAHGHDVTLFTNYPAWAVARFGVDPRRVRSFWPHGVLMRAENRASRMIALPTTEAALHLLFGHWAASQLRREAWDVAYCFSGVAEEPLRALAGSRTLRVVIRGSCHIRTQYRLLCEEEQRTGVTLDRPSVWRVVREEREYALADQVWALSSFAHSSFVAEGVPIEKLRILPLGSDLSLFRPERRVIEERCQRIESGEALRLLYVGGLSFQKGMWDLRTMLASLDAATFQLRLIGAASPEVASLVTAMQGQAEFVPRQPHHSLPTYYAWGDLFIFPTIQDGYAAVLAQAFASGLPILTTTNCSGPDLVHHDKTGWVLPIRSPEMFVERLQWCATHRQELAAMVWRCYDEFQPRDWSDVADDFESFYKELVRDRAMG